MCSGSDISIRQLAHTVQSIIEHEGEIEWDTTKPDGTPRKLMDSSKLNINGWAPQVSLEVGIRDTYEWFLKHH